MVSHFCHPLQRRPGQDTGADEEEEQVRPPDDADPRPPGAGLPRRPIAPAQCRQLAQFRRRRPVGVGPPPSAPVALRCGGRQQAVTVVVPGDADGGPVGVAVSSIPSAAATRGRYTASRASRCVSIRPTTVACRQPAFAGKQGHGDCAGPGVGSKALCHAGLRGVVLWPVGAVRPAGRAAVAAVGYTELRRVTGPQLVGDFGRAYQSVQAAAGRIARRRASVDGVDPQAGRSIVTGTTRCRRR